MIIASVAHWQQNQLGILQCDYRTWKQGQTGKLDGKPSAVSQAPRCRVSGRMPRPVSLNGCLGRWKRQLAGSRSATYESAKGCGTGQADHESVRGRSGCSARRPCPSDRDLRDDGFHQRAASFRVYILLRTGNGTLAAAAVCVFRKNSSDRNACPMSRI